MSKEPLCLCVLRLRRRGRARVQITRELRAVVARGRAGPFPAELYARHSYEYNIIFIGTSPEQVADIGEVLCGFLRLSKAPPSLCDPRFNPTLVRILSFAMSHAYSADPIHNPESSVFIDNRAAAQSVAFSYNNMVASLASTADAFFTEDPCFYLKFLNFHDRYCDMFQSGVFQRLLFGPRRRSPPRRPPRPHDGPAQRR